MVYAVRPLWRVLCWCWVGLPIVGCLPGVPVRLSVVWLQVVASLVVVACGMALPRGREVPQRTLGWLALMLVGLSLLHWRQPTQAFLWACQVVLVLSAAWQLLQHGEARWLRDAVCGCAGLQLVVWGLQQFHVPNPWPAHVWTKTGWGTVGSVTPAAVLLALACLWAKGWRAVLFGAAGLFTGSGTVIPVSAAKGLASCRGLPRCERLSLGGFGLVAIVIRISLRLFLVVGAHLFDRSVGVLELLAQIGRRSGYCVRNHFLDFSFRLIISPFMTF